MASKKQPKNFDGLLAAWLARLDTEELNKKFYRELFDWFEWAVAEGKFPTDKNRTLKPEEHVIRLITRLLFVWFIKEKGLVADELFNDKQIPGLLKDDDFDNGDSYYRAVLQNLFFATLNTEIEKRRFSEGTRDDHRNFSLYRYEDQMHDPDTLLNLFAQTPFINGGLFDCLDNFKGIKKGGYRIDCFSDKHYKKLSLPNRIFFDEDRGLIPLLTHYKFTVEENTPIEQEVALDPELLGKVFENLLAAYNPETGATVRKQTGSYYTPRAIVDYMVEEALVATLAGQVPPTDGDTELWKEELRYLFDYAQVCDDASEWFDDAETDGIVQAISELKILDPAVGSGAFPMGVLHKLTLALRRLDPDNSRWEQLQQDRAGKRAQAAFEISNQQERDVELAEISDTFERYRDSDFGRKLYLIRSSIFGVDIQPIACQIAKLRFFISLAIEQEPDGAADNFGIKPLPNLETRFVAANTLIALQLSEALPLLQDDTVQQLLEEIEGIRGKHFLTNNRQQKLDLEDQEDECRGRLKEELEIQRTKWMKNRKQEIKHKVNQLPNPKHREQLREVEQKKYEGRKKEFDSGFKDAHKIAGWKPYDQNAKADWFDPEWMFSITDGFDVVIGNPPYIQLQKNDGELGNLYQNAGYATFARTGDIYQLFYEKGCQLLKLRHGLLVYITSNSWQKAKYGEALRRYFSEQHTPLRLLEMGKDVFENAIVDTSILLLREGNSHKVSPAIVAVDMDKLDAKDFPPNASQWGQTRPDGEKPWSILSHTEQSVMDKMQAKGTPLRMWDVKINRGITTGYNDAFIIDNTTKEVLITEDPNSADIIKPILRGRDIQRYRAKWDGLWLIYSFQEIEINKYPAIKAHLLQYKSSLEKRTGGARRDRNGNVVVPYEWYELQVDYYNSGRYREFDKEKLFWMDMSNRGRFAYSEEKMYCNDKGFVMTGESLKYLCAILNSALITWLIQNTALTTGLGLTQWKRFAVESLPIPKIFTPDQSPFIDLVDHILTLKTADPDADVSELENEIDQIVYLLYDLTPEEIAIVEEAENI